MLLILEESRELPCVRLQVFLLLLSKTIYTGTVFSLCTIFQNAHTHWRDKQDTGMKLHIWTCQFSHRHAEGFGAKRTLNSF